MLSNTLEETLRRAMSEASSRKHEFATLEHLLLALIEDQDAIEVFKACGVNLKKLEDDLREYFDEVGYLLNSRCFVSHNCGFFVENY